MEGKRVGKSILRKGVASGGWRVGVYLRVEGERWYEKRDPKGRVPHGTKRSYAERQRYILKCLCLSVCLSICSCVVIADALLLHFFPLRVSTYITAFNTLPMVCVCFLFSLLFDMI